MRSSISLLINILGLSVALFLGHRLATVFSLYWTTDWADIVMHTIGGALLCAIVLYAYTLNTKIASASLGKVLLLVIFMGIVWEVFELYTGLTYLYDKGYTTDTLGDIFFDTLGGYLANLFFNRSTR
jgi:hypothetical protein